MCIIWTGGSSGFSWGEVNPTWSRKLTDWWPICGYPGTGLSRQRGSWAWRQRSQLCPSLFPFWTSLTAMSCRQQLKWVSFMVHPDSPSGAGSGAPDNRKELGFELPSSPLHGEGPSWVCSSIWWTPPDILLVDILAGHVQLDENTKLFQKHVAPGKAVGHPRYSWWTYW